MADVIYSVQRTGFRGAAEYRNPRFFQKPLGNPSRVIVVGDWPAVAQSYKSAGVEVVQVEKAADLDALYQGVSKPEPVRDAPVESSDFAEAEARVAEGLSDYRPAVNEEQPIAAPSGDAVKIPANWESLPWRPDVAGGETIRSIAKAVTGEAVVNGQQAKDAINAALADGRAVIDG